MKRTALALAMLFVATSVFGQTTTGNTAAPGSISAGSASNSQSGSASLSGASSNQSQGQGQGQTQSTTSAAGSASTNSDNVSPSQTLNMTTTVPANTTAHITTDGSQTIRSAPSIVGGVMNPTTPCTSIIQGGGSGIGFGVFIGVSVEDKHCTIREFARSLQALGQTDGALAVLCSDENVGKVMQKICAKVNTTMALNDPTPVAVSQGNPTQPVTGRGSPLLNQVEKGNDGKNYRFNGQGWVPISDEEFNQTLKNVQATNDRAYIGR